MRTIDLAKLASALFILSLFGCSTLPTTGDLGFATARVAKEKLFEKNDPNHADEGPSLKDKRGREYIIAIGERVLQKSTITSVEFIVIDNPLVRASSSILGQVYITRGMLNMMSSEAELACVLGHEVAHQEQSLEDNPQKKSVAAREVREAGGVLLPTSVQRLGIGRDWDDIAYANYSKAGETAADEGGARLCSLAGYDPNAFVSFLDRLAQRSEEGLLVRIKKLKGSHEHLKDRAKHLKKYLAQNHLHGRKTSGEHFRAEIVRLS